MTAAMMAAMGMMGTTDELSEVAAAVGRVPLPCLLLWRRRSIQLLSERAAEVQPGGACRASRVYFVWVGAGGGCALACQADMFARLSLCGCGSDRGVLCLRRAAVAAANMRCVLLCAIV